MREPCQQLIRAENATIRSSNSMPPSKPPALSLRQNANASMKKAINARLVTCGLLTHSLQVPAARHSLTERRTRWRAGHQKSAQILAILYAIKSDTKRALDVTQPTASSAIVNS